MGRPRLIFKKNSMIQSSNFYIQWHLENDEMLESMYFVFFKVKCKNFKIK